MLYKLKGHFSTDENCLYDILEDRKVEDIEKYLNPSEDCELNPYDLDNVKEGIEMLMRHLRAKSRILFLIDSD